MGAGLVFGGTLDSVLRFTISVMLGADAECTKGDGPAF